jgi:hypothetical protein
MEIKVSNEFYNPLLKRKEITLEIEHTGDVDGNPATPDFSVPLTDVLVAFDYLIAPSMFGYERHYRGGMSGGGCTGSPRSPPSSRPLFPSVREGLPKPHF